MDEATFIVTLHHLAPDAKCAGVEFPDAELPPVVEKKLRELIRALAVVAATDLGTAAPELRVHATQGRFIVKVVEGRLRINSWDIRVGGSDFSPDQIAALITGTEADGDDGGGGEASFGGKHSRRAVIAVVIAGIVVSNAITAWMAMREPENPFLPEFTILAAEPAERLFTDIAGEYQTGINEGDRALTITKDRRVRWMKFGRGRAIIETADLKVQAVQSRGRPALLADERALIDVPDPVSVIFYNETYRRKSP